MMGFGNAESDGWLAPGIDRLVDLIGEAVVVADRHSGRVIRWSSGAEELLGYSTREASGWSISTFVPELTSTPQWAAAARAESHDGLGHAVELAAFHKLGHELSVAVTLSPLPIDWPDKLHILAILRDLTERKRVVEALEARNREMITVNRIANIALGCASLEAAYQEAVKEISAATGFPTVVIEQYDEPRQLMVFAGATGLPSEPNDSAFEVPLDQTMSGIAVRTGQAMIETHPFEREDDANEMLLRHGVRTFVCIPMIVGGRVIGALTLAHPDILPHVHEMVPWLRSLANFVASLIERKRAEVERLELLNEQSARAQAEASVRARDDFLSIAAHELKTPVAALSAYVQLLARRFDRAELDPRQVREGFAVLIERTNKLARLMAQLLEVSRIDAGKLSIDVEPCDLVSLVRGVVVTTQALTDRHVLSLQAPERATASLDPLRIEQVLTNLLGNAVAYSPDGGSIEVEIGDRPDGSYFIAVRDHGIGIPPQHRERVFERYYQAPAKPRGGMGLGLYVSAQIVQQHGGHLELESPPDGGTRIIVTLPRGPAA